MWETAVFDCDHAVDEDAYKVRESPRKPQHGCRNITSLPLPLLCCAGNTNTASRAFQDAALQPAKHAMYAAPKPVRAPASAPVRTASPVRKAAAPQHEDPMAEDTHGT